MDELHEEYIKEEMPNRVRLTTSCCQINCGGQGDIAINIQHTKPPKIDHNQVANVCERPTVVARCPVAAIRPAMVNGKASLEVDEKKCICCGACFPPCPPMQINDSEHSNFAIWLVARTPMPVQNRPSINWLRPVSPIIRLAGLRYLLSSRRFLVLTKRMRKIGSVLVSGLSVLAGLVSSRKPVCRSPNIILIIGAVVVRT